MVYLICQKESCKKVWDYGGDSKFYATCPDCHNKVNIEKGVAEYEKQKRLHKV